MAKRKCVRVPLVMQMEALECGAACLSMILAYHGKWLSLEKVRADCGVSRDGSNAKNIAKAAQSHGLKVKAYKYEPEDLHSSGTFPCIIHWNFNHFVVLCGFEKNKAVINDPARGRIVVSENEFDEAFTGICLCFEPDECFEKGGKRESILKHSLKKLYESGSSAFLITISSAIASLIGIISLALSGTYVDMLLGENYTPYLLPLIMVFAIAGLFQVVVLAIKEISLFRIEGRIASTGSCSFMWKILNMPMGFFSQRMAGDIQLRMESNNEISKIIVTTLAPLAHDVIMMVLYLVIMLKYSFVLALVGVISVLINLALCSYVSKKKTNCLRVILRDEGKLAASTVSGIEMIETIKSSGSENSFFEKWSGYQASVNSGKVDNVNIDCKIGVLPELILSLGNVFIVTFGVFLVIKGMFTAGMLLAFQGFLNAFMNPAKKLSGAVRLLQELSSDVERVEDVLRYKSEKIFAEEESQNEYNKLSGDIEIKNVSFGYSPLAEPLITNFSMTVKPGQKIAIVGVSGCGKSTIAKLLSGLYCPWEGEILFDGKNISTIDKINFTASVAVVDQDVILFEDTIANNIKMWDSSIEDFEMIMAARDAQIHSDIMERSTGYNYRILEGGKDFSGGQKQRIEIARVLAQDPTIIIMDEATSALDAKTEYDVVKSISDRGITCIVIAHRLSTIRDCDRIIVMENGHIVECGTHEELYANGGLYTTLISNE